ncbi:MAG: acetylxylan esterase [Pirellulaceae bacterium]
MIATACWFSLLLSLAAADDLRCLDENANPAAHELYYSELQRQAYEALDRRDAAYAELETPEQIAAYQQRMREFFIRQLGGFPDRTPLNAQVLGKLPGDGYRVEKVIYESQPNHHVTATLFLPEGDGPFPGVVVASGHSRTAKTAEYNQRFGIALAKNGIAGLCYDPIGQGERSQILSDDGQPKSSSTTREHTLMGVGSILVGTNTARYRIWDGIRSIDYLCSRDDIDAERIGFTGCSGGGTLTSYVMALDDRVRCAAPACYLTTFRRLIETIGPQDAEQNIFGQVGYGMDQTDYALMRAPRPTLISATTGDFFDIQGSWNNFRQAKRIYTRLGFAERVDLVEADGGHGVKPQNLIAIVRWMRRWLLENNDAVELPDITAHAEKELLCTPRGQVLRLPDERSVFDLNRQRETQLAKQRAAFWKKASRDEALAAVREKVGVRPLDKIGKLTMEKAGRVERDGYHIDKVVLTTPEGLPIPALTYHPADPRQDAYLYLHDGGKAADGGKDGPIEKLVSQGYVVVAVDLRGFGETASPRRDATFGEFKYYFLSYLNGQSMVGLRTEDALACGRWVANYQTQTPRNVHLVGVGSAGVVALHAAALEPKRFDEVTLRDTIPSFTKILEHDEPTGFLETAVHGALEVYDLPDLLKTLGDDRVKIDDAK